MPSTRSSMISKSPQVDSGNASSRSSNVPQPARRIKKHKKVRTGCETCKQRKIKCDEARPICGSCLYQTHFCIYRQRQSPYPIFGDADTNSKDSDNQRLEDERDVLRFSARDMGLLHHWTVATAQTIGATSEIRALLRNQVPVMAIEQKKPYLLHAALAVTALHVAFLDPSQASIYTSLGRHHYDIALPLFRENLPFISRDNCHALYACSQTIVKYLFAAEAAPARFFFSPSDASMAEMITLIKGAYLIRDTYTTWLQEGPMAAVATNLMNDDGPEPEPALFLHAYDDELDRLDDRLARLTGHEGPTTTGRVEVVRDALQTLRRLVALNRASDSQVRTKGLCTAWMAQVPSQFFTAVRERKPEALVVLAHFCVVLEEVNSDEVWYMKGWSRVLFEECVCGLRGEWTEFITWPLSVFAALADVEAAAVPGAEGGTFGGEMDANITLP